jgi:hypothetical protein
MPFPPIYRVEEAAEEDPAVAEIRKTHNKKGTNSEGSKIRN